MAFLRIDADRWAALRTRVADGSTPAAPFYALTLLSTTIAAFGLMADSTAVVIGAMLVAPLMGPIFGLALGLVTGDRHLFAQALRAEVQGVALAFGFAVLLGLVVLRPEFGREILSRTEPTLFDLIVAIASGLAGAYALADERISPALPGVAIATAIVPPLATSGIAFAAGEYASAFGAFLLFFANLVAIQLAAAAVFAFAGRAHLHPLRDASLPVVLRRFGLSLFLFVAIGAFLTRTLLRLVERSRLDAAVRAQLTASLASFAGARLAESRWEWRAADGSGAREAGRGHAADDSIAVTAVVVTPQAFEIAQVAALEGELRARIGARASLVVRTLLSRDLSAAGPVFSDDAREGARRDTLAERRAQLVTNAAAAVGARLREVPGAQLVELRRRSDDSTRWVATVQTPDLIGPEQVERLQDTLRAVLSAAGAGGAAVLTVRSLLVQEADAEGFRYLPPLDTLPPPNGGRRGRL